jgi:hypothetical protein
MPGGRKLNLARQKVKPKTDFRNCSGLNSFRTALRNPGTDKAGGIFQEGMIS